MEYLISGSTLTAIADVIRYKTGTTESMTPEQMIIELEKMRGDYDNYIMFLGDEGDFTVTATNVEWDGTVQYSTNRTTWTTWDGSAISSSNKRLYMRGSGNTTFYDAAGVQLVLSAKAGCYGNINALLQYNSIPSELTTANCYSAMFYGCTNLTHAPELPATTLSYCCYERMFNGCTGLTQAPELPATTLASQCYTNMFKGCTGLTQAPELPATTLYPYCYQRMFSGCTGIKLSETRTGEYVIPYRIPTSGTGTTATSSLSSMFTNTGGTFSGTPTINTTYYGAWDA